MAIELMAETTKKCTKVAYHHTGQTQHEGAFSPGNIIISNQGSGCFIWLPLLSD